MSDVMPRQPVDGVAVSASLHALQRHVVRCRSALDGLDDRITQITGWARILCDRLPAGGRLLVGGNGGSAALAQHLTAELVGRFRDERRAFSAIPLCADVAALTAIGNDYGYESVFARQIDAHGRAGDVVLLLSTSGRSENLLEAADAASAVGATCWAMTGPTPNPLASAADDVLAIAADDCATVQEAQQIAVHLLCIAFDRQVADG